MFHRIARFLMFAALYGGSLVLIWRRIGAPRW